MNSLLLSIISRDDTKKNDVQNWKKNILKNKLLFGITICPTDEGADIVMIDIIEFRYLEL